MYSSAVLCPQSIYVKMKIIRTRKRHEYKIIRRTKEKECYLDYIKSACHRFKKDIQLWLTFIEFLKKQYDYSTASSVYLSALQIHSNKHWLWILAAKFEFEVMVSPSSARALFQRALRLMPKCKQLWIEVGELKRSYLNISLINIICYSISNLNYYM
ncbi:unnamed protein product, partial [Didymodactylos carnosus]